MRDLSFEHAVRFVLRWEGRPGSTAYLVWTQTRSGLERVGDFDFDRDRGAPPPTTSSC